MRYLNDSDRDDISADRLRSILTYDAESGVFCWRFRTSPAAAAGSIAGSLFGGYRRIRIAGRAYGAHRLAWLYVHGVWPVGEIDHINGVRDDNRICNLRVVTPQENKHNRHGVHAGNSSGFLGVHRNRDRWRATICVDGRNVHLGVFDDPAEAAEAYLVAKPVLHPSWPG